MHFRQKLHEAYEAGYRSILKEQIGRPLGPGLPTWEAILRYMEAQIAQAEAGQPQDDYALSLYDYNRDGVIDATDFIFAQVIADMFPDAPGGVVEYPYDESVFARPLPPRGQGDMRLRRKKPDIGTKRKGKKAQRAGAPPYFPGGGQKPPPLGGPYPPGGGRPMAPGGQGS